MFARIFLSFPYQGTKLNAKILHRKVSWRGGQRYLSTIHALWCSRSVIVSPHDCTWYSTRFNELISVNKMSVETVPEAKALIMTLEYSDGESVQYRISSYCLTHLPERSTVIELAASFEAAKLSLNR
jgi:hypothetical protein